MSFSCKFAIVESPVKAQDGEKKQFVIKIGEKNLGEVIQVLVNEEKLVGYYEIEFDASSFATQTCSSQRPFIPSRTLV